ncbi:MAG TPA: LytTR family DNA-binding domain-containing protein [Puia sp.]|nr:LytTR family DNA-binding domain-containing protein [Puia sp.]
MITAIIIDDELKGRIALRQKLKDYCPDVELAGEAGDGAEGLKLIEQYQPEIVFLDIEMPGMNGFEMLLQLRRKSFHLIFTTAYDHYAIKAIRFAAFDYLLKPVDIEELRTAIQKIKNERPQDNTGARLEILAHNLKHKHPLSKIAISTMDGLLFFNISDIVHIEAQSNYTVFSFVNRPKLTVSKTLKEFEDMLPPDIFFRPHHSHIINLHYIKRYVKGDGGQIEMQNGEYVDVSRKKKEEFLKLMGI